MGTCASRPANCVRGKHRDSTKKYRRRRRFLKHRATSQLTDGRDETSASLDGSFNCLPSKDTLEESWFDSAATLESDCSDEDFHSVPDGIDTLSLSSIDGTMSPRDNKHEGNVCIRHDVSSIEGSSYGTANDAEKSSFSRTDTDSRVKSNELIQNEVKHVFIDEISTSGGGEDGLLDNCGILPGNCLPCLASTVPSVEKRRSLSSSPPNIMKKAASKLSFKWKEGNSAANLLSTKMLLRRPIAGSQVPFCPLEKRVPDSWSNVEPGTFKIRGINYFRDKKKELASNFAAYYPFGLDLYLSPKKIDHIGRFVELPVINSSGKLPPILVVNVQIPLYPATLFQGETDGEGISFVLYFKLSDRIAKEVPLQESIMRLIDNEVEKTKGFRGDTIMPFRERLKILGRVVNVDDLPLNATERKIMHAYNEKPVLSRPQHEFYSGHNYLEIDLDMHRFSYISRLGFERFIDKLKLCVLDFGLTIQGNKAEELPEQILCCMRLNEIDYMNYERLRSSELVD